MGEQFRAWFVFLRNLSGDFLSVRTYNMQRYEQQTGSPQFLLKPTTLQLQFSLSFCEPWIIFKMPRIPEVVL